MEETKKKKIQQINNHLCKSELPQSDLFTVENFEFKGPTNRSLDKYHLVKDNSNNNYLFLIIIYIL
jgi:hypothetical protein